MKAMTYSRYGAPDVLQLKELPQPVPKDKELLIRVHATTVTTGDWRARTLDLPGGFGPFGRLIFGLTKPRQPILGMEVAGRVEAVGREVTKFKVGDEVFAFTGMRLGCHAEYCCVSEDRLVALKPANLSFEEAASLPFGATTMIDFFRRGALQRGEKVLVNGASGAVGTAAVQLAKYYGAEVTAVCSERNIEFIRSLGADKTIDYEREDFAQSGELYDMIVDIAGTAPFSRSERALKDDGRLLLVLAPLGELLRIPWISLTRKKKVIGGPAAERPDDFAQLAKLAAEGVLKPVIDRRYRFEELAEAHARVETGRKRGSVVVNLI